MSAPARLASAERIQAALERGFAPVGLAVEDQSAHHAGHAGAREGGHFRVRIVSERFRGLTRIARHRLVYDCVAQALGTDTRPAGGTVAASDLGAGTLRRAGIHALAIDARTPEEITS